MTQFPFPTEPDDPNWPWPIPGRFPFPKPILAPSPPPFVPIELSTTGMICMPFANKVWCYDPSTDQWCFVPRDKEPEGGGFKRLETTANRGEGRGTASITFLSNDGLEGRIDLVILSADQNTSKSCCPNPADITYSVGFEFMRIPVLSLHYNNFCALTRWALPPERHDELGRPLVHFALATTAAINAALADPSFGINPPNMASICDASCGAAGATGGVVLGGVLAGLCTGASAGVGAPLCVLGGKGLGAGAGVLAAAGCSWLVCD